MKKNNEMKLIMENWRKFSDEKNLDKSQKQIIEESENIEEINLKTGLAALAAAGAMMLPGKAKAEEPPQAADIQVVVTNPAGEVKATKTIEIKPGMSGNDVQAAISSAAEGVPGGSAHAEIDGKRVPAFTSSNAILAMMGGAVGGVQGGLRDILKDASKVKELMSGFTGRVPTSVNDQNASSLLNHIARKAGIPVKSSDVDGLKPLLIKALQAK